MELLLPLSGAEGEAAAVMTTDGTKRAVHRVHSGLLGSRRTWLLVLLLLLTVGRDVQGRGMGKAIEITCNTR